MSSQARLKKRARLESEDEIYSQPQTQSQRPRGTAEETNWDEEVRYNQ
jgi:hypothetical protein